MSAGAKHPHGAKDSACLIALLDEMLTELSTANERRRRLVALMAQEVAADRQLLELPFARRSPHHRLCDWGGGRRHRALRHAAQPRRLLRPGAPSVEKSGETIRGRGELVNFGRGDVRALLIQAAQSVMRQQKSPLHKWA